MLAPEFNLGKCKKSSSKVRIVLLDLELLIPRIAEYDKMKMESICGVKDLCPDVDEMAELLKRLPPLVVDSGGYDITMVRDVVKQCGLRVGVEDDRGDLANLVKGYMDGRMKVKGLSGDSLHAGNIMVMSRNLNMLADMRRNKTCQTVFAEVATRSLSRLNTLLKDEHAFMFDQEDLQRELSREELSVLQKSLVWKYFQTPYPCDSLIEIRQELNRPFGWIQERIEGLVFACPSLTRSYFLGTDRETFDMMEKYILKRELASNPRFPLTSVSSVAAVQGETENETLARIRKISEEQVHEDPEINIALAESRAETQRLNDADEALLDRIMEASLFEQHGDAELNAVLTESALMGEGNGPKSPSHVLGPDDIDDIDADAPKEYYADNINRLPDVEEENDWEYPAQIAEAMRESELEALAGTNVPLCLADDDDDLLRILAQSTEEASLSPDLKHALDASLQEVSPMNDTEDAALKIVFERSLREANNGNT